MAMGGMVVYAGRTSDFFSRSAAHLRGPHNLKIDKVLTGLTYEEARGVEHALIEHHGLENLLNKINGVSRLHPKYHKRLAVGNELLRKIGYLSGD